MVTFHTQMTNNMRNANKLICLQNHQFARKKPLVLFPPIIIQKTNMHKLTYD